MITPVVIVSAQIQIGQDINGISAGTMAGYSVSMPDINTVAIGGPHFFGFRGIVEIYSWNGSMWIQKGAGIMGQFLLNNCGWSVDMADSNTIAIGSPLNDNINGNEAGHVRIFSWSGSSWVQKGSNITGSFAGDNFGVSVSMPDTNTFAAGAIYNDGNGSASGHVKVYRWNGTAWIQKGSDIYGEAANDFSGYSICMADSNTVAIGAPQNDGNGNASGHVRIFAWNGGGWIQKGPDINGESAADSSGTSVSMPDANTIAIGAPANGGTGQVRVFVWDGLSWIQKGNEINGISPGERAGASVSMPDDNTIAVGAPHHSGIGLCYGQVRVYSWNGIAWLQQGGNINGSAVNDNLGFSVSMSESNTLAVGIPNYTISSNVLGQTKIYSMSPLGIYEINNTQWETYPNPANDNVTIDLKSLQKYISVTVFNPIGMEISHHDYKNVNEIKIPLSGGAGIYFVKVQSDYFNNLLKIMK